MGYGSNEFNVQSPTGVKDVRHVYRLHRSLDEGDAHVADLQESHGAHADVDASLARAPHL
jgi:hypothetical protein